MPLVDYDSSPSSSGDDGEAAHTQVGQGKKRTATPEARPVKRPKKLPSLPSSFDTTPKDDPSLHQGRVRSRPFVEGEYNAHVYLSLSLPGPLRLVLQKAIDDLQLQLPPHTIHSSLRDLHISLSHPLPLRRHQIASVRDDLRSQLSGRSPFKLSFAGGIKVYYNRVIGAPEGAAGRAFFALRVGAGAQDLEDLLDKHVHPVLRRLHLPTYHENPEFHTSFAWCLLRSDGVSPQAQQDAVEEDCLEVGSDGQVTDSTPVGERNDRPANSLVDQRIADLVSARLSDQVLASQPAGGWTVDTVQVKIGRDTTSVRLTG
ncbi:hypothetical protein IAU60_000899 [Kwoniella sp. DSM 27419]